MTRGRIRERPASGPGLVGDPVELLAGIEARCLADLLRVEACAVDSVLAAEREAVEALRLAELAG